MPLLAPVTKAVRGGGAPGRGGGRGGGGRGSRELGNVPGGEARLPLLVRARLEDGDEEEEDEEGGDGRDGGEDGLGLGEGKDVGGVHFLGRVRREERRGVGRTSRGVIKETSSSTRGSQKWWPPKRCARGSDVVAKCRSEFFPSLLMRNRKNQKWRPVRSPSIWSQMSSDPGALS
jgi:hypothetical protein